MPNNVSATLNASQDDDFKVVQGIGPGFEARLNAAGIRTYAQLAAMSPETVVSMLGKVIGLTVKRVVDEDWVGQARMLAAQERALADPDAMGGRQHYATFTVELLLDEDNAVRRTHALCIQSEKEDTCAGWDPNRLLDFINNQAGLQAPHMDEFSPLQPEAPATVEPAKVSGIPILKPTRIITDGGTHHGRILGKDEPFEIILPFDLADLNLSDLPKIDFKLNLNAKALKSGALLMLGEAQGTFELSKENEVTLKCPALDEGVYRIKVDLALNPSLMESESQALQITSLDGGLFLIY
jgi:hypothetical protein